MKKAVHWMSVNGLGSCSGGIGSIERTLETLMNTRFRVLNIRFVPHFVPHKPFCYPLFSGLHRTRCQVMTST
jgi:hypothetical protein